ncbi:MAG: ATP-binding protein [Tepidisphaeraceae bacterium]
MEYVDWVERVLRETAAAVGADRDARLSGVAIWDVARRLDLGIDAMAPEFHASDQRMAIIQAIDDLSDLGLATSATETGNYYHIKLTDEGRRGHTASLRASWPKIFKQVRLDDEMRAFLRAAATRAELRSDRFAVMGGTTAMSVYADLGWEWHPGHAIDLTSSLDQKRCLHANATLDGSVDVRVTYIGVVLGTQEQRTRDQQLLDELLRDWETSTVDFKRELDLDSKTGRYEFAHDVLAIANVQGRQQRVLVVGFDPKTRAPVKSADPRITQDRLEDIINSNVIGRPPEVRWRTVPWHNITAGIVEIVRDPAALPYRAGALLSAKYGSDVLIRRGTHNAVADLQELADLHEEAARAKSRDPAP